MNQGNVDMTAQMGPATFPLVTIIMNDRQINRLHGYAEPMETSYLRETLTPLGDGRSLNFKIDKFNNTIESIAFEVRSIDGTRLIETSEITDYEENRNNISAQITIKDLINPDEEYTFVLLIKTEMSRTIRFYTRIFTSNETNHDEKINYCFQFHEKTFNKEEARELTQYLEPNAFGDNTTFNRVTINSSFHQVTWGNLEVNRISEPILYVKEMAVQTGSFRIKYNVTLFDDHDTYYRVEEFYRIRYTPDRIFLLDFERTMEEVFTGDPQNFTRANIYLGITSPQVALSESDGGNVFAFENNNNLYSMVIPDRKFVRLFGFYDEENNDVRCAYPGHRARILNVDETGNIVYMVYGYMNRGRHEGKVGIAVYYYNSMMNTIDELVYIPYHKSPELLLAEIEQMVYLNRNMRLYIMMDNEIYAIHPESRSYETVITGMQEGAYHISESNRILVWQDSDDIYGTTQLNILNLQDERQSEITAGYNEYIKPLGFMGEDLIYGLAKASDITNDAHGNVIFPMYAIRIQNEAGEVLKHHHQRDYYVSGLTINENLITLHRLTKVGEEDETYYTAAVNTQITNQIIPAGSVNKVEVIATERLLRIVRIAIKQEVDPEQIILLSPREILFEGGRDLHIEQSEPDINRYYVYGKNGIIGIYLSEAKAVNTAYDNAGVVINRKGEYIWFRGNLSPRNQITAIQGSQVPLAGTTLAVCLDAILRYEGITQNTHYMLRRGQTPISILQDNLPDIQVLDLTGCYMDTIFYYLNRNIPVLKLFEDGNAILITGFNEQNIIVMDPKEGEIIRIGRNDSQALFDENGNRFITYIRNRR